MSALIARTTLLTILAMAGANAALAGGPSQQPWRATAEDVGVALITYGPADSIMSHFGHAAIVLYDRRGQSELYELATDSPDHRLFLPWYLTPQKLIYQSQSGELSPTLHGAFLQRRDVQLRELNLKPESRSRLAAGIASRLKPELAHFEFGVYTRNCTTRIRDLLDEALGGELRRQLSGPARWSFRQHSLRAFAAKPMVALALDLSVGRLADHTPTRWEESFHPEALAMALDQIELDAETGLEAPLVESTQALLDGSPELRMAAVPPSYSAQLAAAGLGLLVLLSLARRQHWTGAQQLQSSLLVAFGLIGVLLCYLWLVGGERVASWNENLLLFNPLLLGLVAARSVRWQRAMARLVLASVALALLLKFLPHPQANLGWIALAGPTATYAAARTLLARSAGGGYGRTSGGAAQPRQGRLVWLNHRASAQ